MANRPKLAMLLVAWGCAASSSAQAEPSASYVMKQIDGGGKIDLLILDAYSNGFEWANTDLKIKHEVPLFCAPQSLAITPDQNASILRDVLRDKPALAEAPAGLAMLYALKQTFPCEAK